MKMAKVTVTFHVPSLLMPGMLENYNIKLDNDENGHLLSRCIIASFKQEKKDIKTAKEFSKIKR